MKEVQLTKGYVAFVDDEDFEKASKIKWYPIKGKNTMYATGFDKGVKPQKDLRLHWFILGKPDKGVVIDHKDGNGLNNQKSNLRFCTNKQNSSNRKPYGSSIYLGVCNRKGNKIKSWEARIVGKYIGIFSSEIEAAQAYNEKAKEIHGEFANLNVIKY